MTLSALVSTVYQELRHRGIRWQITNGITTSSEIGLIVVVPFINPSPSHALERLKIL